MTLTASAPPDTRLTGRRLGVARGVWIVVVALAVGLYLISIPLTFAYYNTVCSSADCPFGQVSPAGLEQLRQAGLSLGLYAGALAAFGAFVTLVFLFVAAVIFWRKSDDWMAIFASLTLVLLGVCNDSTALVLVGQQYPALLFLSQFVALLGNACVVLFFYLFPDGRFAPRWIVWLVPLWLAKDAVAHFRPDLYPNDWLFPFELASILFAQIYHYWRVSNTVQRQQTKWVVFGSAVGVGGILGLTLLFAVLPPAAVPPAGIADLFVFAAFSLFSLLIPLSIGMAILRSRLWDIDLLIRRTLAYAVLTGLLALAYFGSVLVLESLVHLLTGQTQSQVVTVISTLAIAALFVPLRRRVQAFIDRRFYRRKYDASRTLARFGAGLRDEVNLDDLSAHLLAAVDETMQPESVALWLRAARDEGQRK